MKGGRWALLKVAVGYELYVARDHAWCNRGEGCNEDGYIETDCDACGGWGTDDETGKACDECDGAGYNPDLTELGECMRLHDSWKQRRWRTVDRARVRRLIRGATKCRRPCLGCCFEYPSTAGLKCATGGHAAQGRGCKGECG